MFLGCLSELFEMRINGTSNEEVNDYFEMLIDIAVKGFSIHLEKIPGSGEVRAN